MGVTGRSRGEERRAEAPPTDAFKAFVVDKSAGLYITFLSIVIGIALADLLGEARGRMHLWPLSPEALRDWGQVGGIAGSALGTWAIYAYLGISRRGVPSFSESISAFAGPLFLVFATTVAGRPEGWPWFYAAAGFLLIEIFAAAPNVRQVAASAEGRPFLRILRPAGYQSILYLGVPLYALAGFGAQAGWLPVWAQAVLTLSTIPAAVITAALFFHDWHAALEESQAAAEPTPPAKGSRESPLLAAVKDRGPDVFVTMNSIMIGMALQFLVSEARGRMPVWPLNMTGLITWAEIFAVAGALLAAWVAYSHMGISRRGAPWYGETLSTVISPALMVPVILLAGREPAFPFLYAGGVYLLGSGGVALLQVYYARGTDFGDRLGIMARPTGYTGVVWVGGPYFLLCGLADQLGWMPPWMELAAIVGSVPAGPFCAWLFFRDWRKAIGA
jgi:hypothetical protein